ncbi:MAG: hypothetical protein MJY69_02010 [Bacteroidales bacterium]|nr:hypothetical protein [Bacteroidales bacterium]
MKKIFLASVVTLTVCTLVFSGCNKDSISEEVDLESIESSEAVVGTSDYIAQLATLAPTLTKSGELSEEDARIMIAPLLAESIKYLADNGYDCLEDFETLEDPRITWVAMGLAELDLDVPETKSTVGGCVLQAIGLDAALEKGLAKKAVKKTIKKIATKAVAKAIPYVGEVLIAADFVYCLVTD